MFFLGVCGITLLTAAFVTPVLFDVFPTWGTMLRGLVKYLITFAFFVLGYNLARRNGLLQLLRFYSWSALSMGAVGVVLTLSGSGVFRDFLFLDGGDRYLGLVSDPNLWAICVVAGMPYFMRAGGFTLRARILVVAVAAAAVLVTGSKTGFLALIVYLAYLTVRWAVSSSRSQRNLPAVLVSIAAFLVMIPLLPSMESTSEFVVRYIPIAERVTTLFLDPEVALNEGGSGREEVLTNASIVVGESPLVGVGVGQYLPVVTQVTGRYALAHNTYLQMAADWGIPLTVLLFVGVLLLMGKKPAMQSPALLVGVQREMLAVLLIGSLSVSFNNVRLFWILLGSLAYCIFGLRNDWGVLGGDSPAGAR